ncbi:c-type cytochrome domain-containing protein [Pedobacter sp. JCM 36344]|uniref:c-type cytochrome domain-containing protein n=1 Tax=Pedobacter sp. JCM 36344 TaxID=3374280 RepID=UPI00397BF8F7
MRLTLKGFAENLLVAADVFIVFLLIAGSSVIVPVWLMPVGRMHPMLLHFPIVLLMLAMVLEYFRFKSVYTQEPLYQSFASGLMLTSVVFSAITVIMGLFLSKEPAYGGSLLNWHKWTGVSVVFLGSLIYWCRNALWYKASAAKTGAVLLTLVLIITGHYGGTLTHGDNFVLEPISKPKAIPKVPIEQARVFEDVILPIFSQKCLSCHNLEKAKGGLVLSDAQSVVKGGKTGPLYVPGNAQMSLLLQRIHLPMDEKKHMPPKNEAQLTNDEMAILKFWVQQNAELKKKVLELADTDSLRILAAIYLTPVETIIDEEEDYDFSAANEEDVKKLNNNYRSVSPLAKNSPALSVTIFNKGSFKLSVLKELEPIRKQIISLNLSGMPVSDEYLKQISEFINLRKLNLNFTKVKGGGLKYLKKLASLRALSLSGTDVTFKFVNEYTAKSTIKRLILWETKLSPAEIKQLQKQYKKILIVGGFDGTGQFSSKLNPPKLNVESSLFKQAFNLELKHVIKGVEIRYTLDGSDPDSLKAMLYKNPIPVSTNIVLKMRSYKKGWISSDMIEFPLYKSSYKPDSISNVLLPEENLNGGRAPALIDGQFGTVNIFQGRWAGYIKNNMETLMLFKQPVLVQSVGLNAIRHLENSALLPQVVEVWGGKDSKHLKLLGTNHPTAAKKGDQPLLVTMEIQFKPQLLSCIKLVAKTIKKLPEWHPGKGKPPVLFVDEILIN